MNVKILLFLFLATLSSSCSVNKLISEAHSSFSKNEFYSASEKYRIANSKLKDREQKTTLYFNLAESYHQMGDYAKAAIWYKNAIRMGYKDSSIQLLYADALRGAGKPDEAKLIYESELKKEPTSQWASNGLESLRKIQEWNEYQELYQIENFKPGNSISNDLLVQILPEKQNTLCLNSSRTTIPDKNINPATGQKYSGFFTTTYDSLKKSWSVPELMNDPATLNSPNEEVSLNFDPSNNFVVFERSIEQPQKPAVHQLFFMLKKDGRWLNPSPISFSTDGSDYENPMITADGKTLWFSSNRPGGKGGFDIWFSKIADSGVFSEPVNAGNEINTSGNEKYPFQKPNEQLYFSSDFHPGIGGYDVFQAQKNGEKWKIEQLPPPINSAGDDVAIQFYGIKEKGYFSSNRKGSKGMDIYSFFLPPKLFQCFGHIRDSETDSILPDANIRIVGSDGSSQRIRSVNGQFQASLNPNSDYAIVVFANGYLNAQAKVSTRGLLQAKEFEVEIKPIPTNRPIRMENINYELGKWELLPQSKTALEKLINLLKLNPEAIIEISSHTDDQGDEKFNQELSEKRAASVVNYLSENGIPQMNLKPKGYGESNPLKISSKQATQYPFLHEGDVLNLTAIEKLSGEKQKETARSLNRRTEFKVIRSGTIPE